jgi:hypothetical protein
MRAQPWRTRKRNTMMLGGRRYVYICIYTCIYSIRLYRYYRVSDYIVSDYITSDYANYPMTVYPNTIGGGTDGGTKAGA